MAGGKKQLNANKRVTSVLTRIASGFHISRTQNKRQLQLFVKGSRWCCTSSLLPVENHVSMQQRRAHHSEVKADAGI